MSLNNTFKEKLSFSILTIDLPNRRKKLNGYGLEMKGRVKKDKWNLVKIQKTTAWRIKINRRRRNMRKKTDMTINQNKNRSCRKQKKLTNKKKDEERE